MYITPDSKIYVLKNVPLDGTYEHTINFSNASDQFEYFNSKVKKRFNKCTYQRAEKIARVGALADDILDCNYIMFQNTAFGDKWFYAFINSVTYINDNTTGIEFTIDVMQTWLFDFDIDYCFVDREHVSDDTIGKHILPENVSLGEYVMNTYNPILDMTDNVVCIAIVDTTDNADGTLYDGIYGSAQLFVYDSTDTQGINSKIDEYLQAPDSIISMYMFPMVFINDIPKNHKLSYGKSASKTTVKRGKIQTGDTLDGYVPKNNKLYTYPYCFYHIDNASGNELSLRYEFFEDLTPTVEICGTITQPVQAVLRPCSYKGVKGYDSLGGYTTYNAESLTLTSYPVCSWNMDYYQAWIAQNSIPLALSTVNNVASMGLAGAYSTSPIAVTGLGIAGQISSVISQAYQASISADISKGSQNNGGVNVANNTQQFYGGRCSITAQYAKMIDDYFTMYGYSVKRCKKPNITSRKHWNYIKTIGCTLTGSVPYNDMQKIAKIFDNGITFWHNPGEIGDYSLDNTI